MDTTSLTTPRAWRSPAAADSRAGERSRFGLRTSTSWALACAGVDVAMLAAAALAGGYGARAAGVTSLPLAWTGLFAVVALVLVYARGMYRVRLRVQSLDDVRGIVTATSISGMAVLFLTLAAGHDAGVLPDVVRLWAFAAVYASAGRVALNWANVEARRDGTALRPTLIVGAGNIGNLVAKRLLDHPELGLLPVGFLDKDPLEHPTAGRKLPVLGASWDLEHIVAEHGVEQVIFTFSTAPHDVLLNLVNRCNELGLEVSLVPRLFEKVPGRLTIEHVGGLPLVTTHASNPRGWQFAVKYALDRIVGAVAVVFFFPLLAAAAVAVYVSMGRPIFFRQVRVGRDGRPFEMLKFRSMRLAAPGAASESNGFTLPDGAAPGGVEGDDRRTRVGAFLRRTSIDELPQLLNVVKGDMSLVGPRPERPEFVELFEENVYRYGDRHRVKAGITGWAQVHGLRGKTSIADRVEWDNYYIENWSLWLDVKTLLMTVLAVFSYFRTVE